MGLIEFGTDATTELSLGDPQSQTIVEEAVIDLEFSGGWTNTLGAIQSSIAMFDTSARVDSRPVLLILTDGQPYGPNGPEEVCVFEDAIKSRGIQVIIIGIGHGWVQSDGAQKTQCLVHDPQTDLLSVPDFESLELTGLLEGT